MSEIITLKEWEKALRETRKAMAKGLVVFPTDTVYGVGTYIDNEEGIKQIYEVKGRDPEKPIAVLVSSIEQARELGKFNELAESLALRYWPGPLTIIVEKTERVPDIVSKSGVGLRMPNHRFVLELATKPIVASSANLSGKPAPTRLEECLELGEEVLLFVDGGNLSGIPSTVVDTRKGLVVIRKGPVDPLE